MSTILISFKPDVLADEHLTQIERLAPDARVVVTDNRDEMEALLEEIEIVAGWVPTEVILEAPNLRWVQQWSAGADWLLQHPEVVEKDFILTSTSGIHAIQITEHIFALLLAFARRLHDAVRAQSRQEWWSPQGETLFELEGKTLLLIGVGAIGERTAQVATAMGMRVLGVRNNPSKTVPNVERMVGPDHLQELLPKADFVVLTVPLTDETRGMIGQSELQQMKPNAILINIGRGGTVDEESLARALQEGWIAGAGLDVFEEEPLPEESPLWDMDNVIITAHYAGATPHYHERAMAIFLDNLQRYQAGEPLRNVVDKTRGY
ncbi:MAG: D-2-hydroxyacid dehydrogenase [Chloroflexota bacterium]|nr:D-2-hydroxyacid dehydrogenase [Chloroflexota bacterium]